MLALRREARQSLNTAKNCGIAIGSLMLAFSASVLAQHEPSLPPFAPSSPQAAGQQVYATLCASCHGTSANGGEFAPSIVTRVPVRSDDELRTLLRDGLPSGMPSFPNILDPERSNLISFLRTLKTDAGLASAHINVNLEDGKSFQGVALNRAADDMQLLGDDHKLYLLRQATAGRYRVVTSQTDWPNYDGPIGNPPAGGSRYSTINQISATNVAGLQAKWFFTLRNTGQVQSTPVVAGGLLYVTAANECYALDAGNGRLVWHYVRARTKGIGGVSATGINRGVAVASGKVFMITDNAHLIALNATTGSLIWDTTMVDWHDNYNANSAPLLVGDKVLSGVAGGEDGARGFVAAFDQTSGKEIWRFWSVPERGEKGSETWIGPGIEHPGGSTWFTGVYDTELDTVYWPIGNPSADLIGDNREGDNLYTDSVVALDPKSGRMKWYFQFTPHDLHDFDAAEPLALIDTEWQGKPRKLLVQANRNGFFYVLDRTDGKYLLGRAYTPKLTWATGLTPAGRPIVAQGKEATHEGILVCPWIAGASNWYSSSYNPSTGLYYVQTNDKCGIFIRTDMTFEKGRSYVGGSVSGDPANPGQRILRAFDIHTGKPVWEIAQTGAADTSGGVLSTAGGLVFYGADDGAFAAIDATNGKSLWSFQTNQLPHASPMTYVFDHKQYVAVASGSDIIAFALPN
jgi:alcohol dehydrogenase (cytochrome c)